MDKFHTMSDFADNMMEYKESARYNQSLEFENEILRHVELGDLSYLDELQFPIISDINTGKLSDNEVRNTKNLAIVFVALVSRAAIRGGMSVDNSFMLSDLYIQKIEAINDVSMAAEFYVEMLTTYITGVAKTKDTAKAMSDMRPIIEYVRLHTNEPITVDEIAKNFGYNSNYLSGKFKKEFGFSLSSFILRTKLEEARQLLRYTDKSLLEISTYLCFCSQSHFQNCFKKQYGVTPGAYRKQ